MQIHLNWITENDTQTQMAAKAIIEFVNDERNKYGLKVITISTTDFDIDFENVPEME